MLIEHTFLSNHIILSVLKEYLGPLAWVNFLVSLCNPSLGVSNICRNLGITGHLEKLQNPLIDGWEYDEDKGIITI